MKTLIALILLITSASVAAQTKAEQAQANRQAFEIKHNAWKKTNKAKKDAFNMWFMSQHGQSEAYYLTEGSPLCGRESNIKALHNYALQTGGNLTHLWMKHNNCRVPRGWHIAKVLQVKDIAIQVQVYNSIFGNVQTRWVHSSYLELWFEYKKRFK